MDFSGEWIGSYPGHHDEIIEIVASGTLLIATKVTGDDYVPAGEITWRADLATGIGEGQIAEHEFHRPRYVPGRLTIHDVDHLTFCWGDSAAVEFRRDV